MLQEAGIAWNFNLNEWECADAVTKGKALAHYLEKQIREGYENEKQEEANDRKKSAEKNKNKVSPISFRHREAMARAKLQRPAK